MIPPWVKAVVLGALVLFTAVDLGAPLVVRVQLDGTAADATSASGREWLRNRDLERARSAAQAEAEQDGATVERFELLPDGRIGLAVAKVAPARVFDRWEQLDTWYVVRVDATSTGSTL